MATAAAAFPDTLATEMAAVLDDSKKHQRGDTTGRDALEALLELSARKDSRFSTFAKKLEKLINTCFVHKGKCRLSTAKDKAFKRFIEARTEVLPAPWIECISSLGSDISWNPFLPQCVNRRVFNIFLVKHFSSPPTVSPVELKMTAEDENALRYTCGYVALKVMRRFQQQNSTKATQFVDCLSDMAVTGQESSFYEYTTEWIHQVDRGGLFHVNEQAYLFFRALELKTRITLPDHLKRMQGSKQSLVSDVMEDENVQFYWTMVSVDIDREEDAQELLQKIVEVWLTIRGFSTTAVWLEEYKKASQKTTKKSKSLRRGLKDGTSV